MSYDLSPKSMVDTIKTFYDKNALWVVDEYLNSVFTQFDEWVNNKDKKILYLRILDKLYITQLTDYQLIKVNDKIDDALISKLQILKQAQSLEDALRFISSKKIFEDINLCKKVDGVNYRPFSLITKYLHFLNPANFPIFDKYVHWMWNEIVISYPKEMKGKFVGVIRERCDCFSKDTTGYKSILKFYIKLKEIKGQNWWNEIEERVCNEFKGNSAGNNYFRNPLTVIDKYLWIKGKADMLKKNNEKKSSTGKGTLDEHREIV